MSWFTDRGQELDQVRAVIRVQFILWQWAFLATGRVRRVFWIVGNGRAKPFGSNLLTACLEGLYGLYGVVSESNAVEEYVSNENGIHHGCDSGDGR